MIELSITPILLGQKFSLQDCEELFHADFHVRSFQSAAVIAGSRWIKGIPCWNVQSPKFFDTILKDDKAILNTKKRLDGLRRSQFMDRYISECTDQTIEDPFVISATNSKMPFLVVVSQIWEPIDHRYCGRANRQNRRLPLFFRAQLGGDSCLDRLIHLRSAKKVSRNDRSDGPNSLHPAWPLLAPKRPLETNNQKNAQNHEQHQADTPIFCFHNSIVSYTRGSIA